MTLEQEPTRKVSLTGIDPTRNVTELVSAEGRHQDAMRDAQARFEAHARDADGKLQSWMRDAETKRVDQLAQQKANSDKQISDMLAESVKSTSMLVSTQLLQIQSTFDTRVAKLEEFRLLSTGRASVADPQLASSMASFNKGLIDLKDMFEKSLTAFAAKQAELMAQLTKSVVALQDAHEAGGGKAVGQQQVLGWVAAGVIFLSSLIYPAWSIFHGIGH